MEDKKKDLLPDGVDVALRLRQLPDSGATARRIGFNEGLLAASSEYLRLVREEPAVYLETEMR
jgi:hypothetical protein